MALVRIFQQWKRPSLSRLALLPAILALFVQAIVFSVHMPAPDAEKARLAAFWGKDFVLCAHLPNDRQDPAPQHHTHNDCPTCQSLRSGIGILPALVLLPPARSWHFAAHVIAPAVAGFHPPIGRAGHARAPPSSSV